MAERHLYQIRNKSELNIGFELRSPAAPSSQGQTLTLAPGRIAVPPDGVHHWTIPVTGPHHGTEDHPCVLSSTDAAGRILFRFTLAVEADPDAGASRSWANGGFSIWAGKPVVAGCPDAMRILEPFPPFPADAPEAREVILCLTGKQPDGTDLRVDVLPYVGPKMGAASAAAPAGA